MEEIIIDVREKDEFKAEHVEHSVNIPLSQIDHIGPGVLNSLKDRSLTIMCLSGKRADLAMQRIEKFGISFSDSVKVYEGGIKRWKSLGGSVVELKKTHLPIMRQTHLAAGLLALTGTLLGFYVNPSFLVIPGFVGLGLSVAGSTGFCGMGILLSHMPWNK